MLSCLNHNQDKDGFRYNYEMGCCFAVQIVVTYPAALKAF